MNGKVYLVGAGPGDPDLLTRKAFRILWQAEAVLHDALVSPEVLALIPPAAEVRNVGKRCGQKRISQEEINSLLINAARRGLTVVRLKGGDPLVFGRAAEEMDALRDAGVEFEVVPGVTAALGAAAAAQVSLTDRRLSSKIVLVTGRHCSARERTDWANLAAGDTTVVLYMPGSDYEGLVEGLTAGGLGQRTPCLIVSRAATPQQQVHRTTLDELPRAPRLPAPALLIIGAVAGSAQPAEESLKQMEQINALVSVP